MLASPQLQERIQSFATKRAHDFTAMISDNKNPIFIEIKNLFTNPKKCLKEAFDLSWTANRESVADKFDSWQSSISEIFQKYNINYTTLISLVAFSILAILIYTFIAQFSTKSIEETIYKMNNLSSIGLFSCIYIGIWGFVLLLGFVNSYLRSSLLSITFESLFENSKLLITCLLVATAIFLFFSAFLAALPYSSIGLPFIAFSILAIVKFYCKVNVSLVNLGLIVSFLAICLGFALLLINVAPGLVSNFMKAFSNLAKSAHLLFGFFFITSIFQYIQILALKSIWGQNETKDSSLLFVLVFLFAWSYYSMSFLNQLFTAVQLKNKSMGTSDICDVICETFSGFNFISFCSCIPAMFHSIISILTTIQVYLQSSNSTILKIFSLIFLISAGILKTFLALLNAKVSSNITRLGYLGEKEYFKKSDKPEEFEFSYKAVKSQFFSIFDIQFSIYVALSVAFFTGYNLFIENYTYLIFPLFVSLNILVHFINALYTSYLVGKHASKCEKVKVNKFNSEKVDQDNGTVAESENGNEFVADEVEMNQLNSAVEDNKAAQDDQVNGAVAENKLI